MPKRGPTGHTYPEYRAYANVALGLYAGAAGMTSDQMNWVADYYASGHSTFPNQVMDTQFPHLPQENVDNTVLGVILTTTGNGFGICTPLGTTR